MHLPLMLEETQATAQAAGLAYWQLLVAGGLSDIDDVVGRPLKAGLNECTIVSSSDEAAAPYLIGTWDTHASAAASGVIVRRIPDDRPKTLGLSVYGWPLQDGIGETGLACANANLVADVIAPGVSFIAMVAPLVSCTTLGDAIDLARRVPHCSGRFYALANKSEYTGLEVLPPERVHLSTAHVAHTNHYVLPGTREHEGRPQYEDSQDRLVHAGRVESAARGQRSAVLAEMFQDAKLIRTGSGDDDATGAFYVLRPGDQAIDVMWIMGTNDKDVHMVRYNL